MLAAAKAGIYRSPGERLALPTMAGGCPAEGLLKPPARLGIVEDLRSPLDYHLLNDIDNGVEIIESFERQRRLAAERAGTVVAVFGEHKDLWAHAASYTA